jgi:hypothetical protein
LNDLADDHNLAPAYHFFIGDRRFRAKAEMHGHVGFLRRVSKKE